MTKQDTSSEQRNRTNEMIAAELLKIKAVFLRPEQPFTWASGIKSPVYCDNRLVLSEPQTREKVEQALADTVRREFPDCEMLMGTSTAGIAHAAIAAHMMGLPMGYVRSAAKDHGRANRIEGHLDPGERTVVIEDLVSTGGSLVDTVRALREAGAQVLGAVSIFTYGMEAAAEAMKTAAIKHVSLADLDMLADTAARKGYIDESEKQKLIRFRDDPQNESWMMEK